MSTPSTDTTSSETTDLGSELDTDTRVIPETHVIAEIPTDEVKELIQKAKKDLKSEPGFADPEIAAMYDDATITRFLRARVGYYDRAIKLLQDDIAWRTSFKPHNISATDVEDESRTGKMRVSERLDRFGRPVIVMHALYENTKTYDGQIKFLVWNLERAIKMMSNPVSKYCVFINMEGFSIWNAPPAKVSKETATCLSARYPERLGQAIIWQPPLYFRMFYSVVSPFIDVRTKSKIKLVSGEHGPGSKIDLKLRDLIGPNWREVTGIDQKQVNPKVAPGYDHSIYWPRAVQFEKDVASGQTAQTSSSGPYDHSGTLVSSGSTTTSGSTKGTSDSKTDNQDSEGKTTLTPDASVSPQFSPSSSASSSLTSPDNIATTTSSDTSSSSPSSSSSLSAGASPES